MESEGVGGVSSGAGCSFVRLGSPCTIDVSVRDVTLMERAIIKRRCRVLKIRGLIFRK